MSRRRRAPLLLLGLLVAAAPGHGPAVPPPVPPGPPREKLEIGGETFRLETALDGEARARGLAGREDIDDDGGMLFVFPSARRLSFWMKGCLVEIDVLFLDDHGRILRVHEMKTEPPRGDRETLTAYERRLKRYTSGRPARYAVELKAGSIKRLKLKPGQTIELDGPRLRKLAR